MLPIFRRIWRHIAWRCAPLLNFYTKCKRAHLSMCCRSSVGLGDISLGDMRLYLIWYTMKKTTPKGVVFISLCRHQPIFPVRRQTSIFGACELNFCVRNGNRWTLAAINTYYEIGDPYGNRTHVCGVRGRRLNRLTNGPFY